MSEHGYETSASLRGTGISLQHVVSYLPLLYKGSTIIVLVKSLLGIASAVRCLSVGPKSQITFLFPWESKPIWNLA